MATVCVTFMVGILWPDTTKALGSQFVIIVVADLRAFSDLTWAMSPMHTSTRNMILTNIPAVVPANTNPVRTQQPLPLLIASR